MEFLIKKISKTKISYLDKANFKGYLIKCLSRFILYIMITGSLS